MKVLECPGNPKSFRKPRAQSTHEGLEKHEAEGNIEIIKGFEYHATFRLYSEGHRCGGT